MLKNYLDFIFKARWWLALAFLGLFAFSVEKARHLELKSDFKELLPANFQSVIDLNKIVERIGGNGSLIVAIESDDPEASIRFGEALVGQLKEYPPELIHRIEYNAGSLKTFFMDHKYLYMDLEDIKTIHDRLERRIGREKLKKSGIYLDFETDETSKRSDGSQNGFEDDFQDIKDKYKSKTSAYEHYRRGYFFDESQKLMAIVIRPPGSAIGIEFSKQLLSKVQDTIDHIDPKKYDPTMKVRLTGHFRRVLFEYQTLYQDIASTAGLCILLVGVSVFIYYRRLRMVLLMAWATFNGTFWAFALTEWKIGYLTTQTAFLGSIIIGNGINHGLILMARYLEERRSGRSPLESLHISVPATLTGTLASSVTTAASFGILMISSMRGFSQFGFIGGWGMFFCWLATYTVLPVFLLITEQILPVVREKTEQKRFLFSVTSILASRLDAWSKPIVAVGTLLTVLSIPMMIYFAPDALEYDLNKLRVKMKGQDFIEDTQLNERVKKIFGGAVTPTVLVTDKAEESLPLCREILRKNDLDSPEKRVIDSCKSLYSYIPEDQEAKIEWLGKIRRLIDKNTFDFLDESQKKSLKEFKEQFTAQRVSLADLPEALVVNFREKNGDLGKLVYIYTNDKLPLWNGKNLIHFADLIRQNRLPSGEVVTSSGDAAIFADIFRAVAHDGPRVTAVAFVAVCLIVIFLFREKIGSIYIIGTLALGILLMGGVVALLGIKINFFNFIAIPTTFGIGVDYGCNIYQRYRLEGRGSLPHVLKTTGGAVLLCSITTIIGYFTLIIAKNQALVSFGWIAIIGEATCLLSALVLVPALVVRLERRFFRNIP